jgi:outer membrane PBP1 activator LpoA protein
MRPLILSPEYQAMRDETPYYRAAWLAARSGAPDDDVTKLLIQASWEAATEDYIARVKARLPNGIASTSNREEQNALESLAKDEYFKPTSSARYKRYATELISRLTNALSHPTDERAKAQNKILIGELLRRLHQFEEARHYLETIASDFSTQNEWRQLIAFELKLIAKQDAGIHLMSETRQ